MVLGDHVKKGKKLLPPMMAAGTPIELGEWMLDRVPEFFWLAMLVNRIGIKAAAENVAAMAKSVQATLSRKRCDSKVFRAYLFSEHGKLTKDEKTTIARTRAKWAGPIKSLIAELKTIWPDLPMGYLARKNTRTDKSRLTNELRDVLSHFSHRHDKLALSAQAIVVASEIESGHCSIAQGLEIPNLNAVFDFPTTDESKDAAGFVVTMCGSLAKFGRETPDLAWNRSFWNGCYRLTPCEYDHG